MLFALQVVFNGDRRHVGRVELPLVGLAKASAGIKPGNCNLILGSERPKVNEKVTFVVTQSNTLNNSSDTVKYFIILI